MRSIFRHALVVATVCLVAVILAGFAASFHPLFDSIGHFRFHLTALVLPAVVVLWLAKMRRAALLGLLFGVLSAFSMQLLPPLSDVGAGSPVRFVQFNALFSNQRPKDSANWIRSMSPDIVTLQEVSPRSRVIMDELKADLPHQLLCEFATVGGVAVLSKKPFGRSGCIKGDGLAWVVVDGATYASLHLHWPYPYRQKQQIARLKPELAAMPRPVVLGGDFNAAPWSAAAREIAEATDTRVVSGLRLTLRMGPPPLGPLPFMPIDHVLIPRDAAVSEVETGPQIGSDHHPVFLRLGLCCDAM
jgi:endonuclease/exonuclease/phosphatase (EEP) superfamily protein YafD